MHKGSNFARKDSAKCDESELSTKELGERCCLGSRSRKQSERKNCDRPEMNAVEADVMAVCCSIGDEHGVLLG